MTPSPDDSLPKDVPRRYQEEVFERAQKENIIAALKTGAGKTLISLLLIRWIAAQSSTQRKIVVFLVPKITLVAQQCEYLQKRTPLRVGKLHGTAYSGLSLNHRSKWRKFFQSYDIIVMTAQKFLNIITHALWSLDKVSLLVFDECHHTRQNHPYNGIMREYFQVTDVSKRPKIFGMTASPVWNIKNSFNSISTLEENMDAKVVSVIEHVDELRQHSAKTKEEVRSFPYPPEQFDYPSPSIYDCLKVIDKLSWNQLEIPWSKIEIRYMSTLANIGPHGASLFLFLEIQSYTDSILAENKKRLHYSGLDDVGNGIPSSTSTIIPDDFLLILEIIQDFRPFFPLKATNLVSNSIPLDWFTPKVKVLADILAENYTHTPTFQGIIFVDQRHIASILARVLPTIPQLSGKIKCAYITGQGNGREGLLKVKDNVQRDPIQLFRDRTINILIATSVAEEGLDFPACDLVVRFDSLHDLVGYVQSRGRARNKAAARFVVMIQEENKAQLEKFLALQAEEPKIDQEYQTRHLKVQDEDKDDDDQDMDVDDSLYQADLSERDRYVEPSTGSMITYDNALSLLNYLCSIIPHDEFTPIHKPSYIEGFQTTLTLPRALPLASVDLTYVGPVKRSHREAKRAVAFMAVKRLRELNVFDEYLLPVPAGLDNDDPKGTFRSLRELKAKTAKMDVPAVLTVPVRDPWCIGEKLWLHPVAIDGQVLAGLVTSTPLVPEEVNIVDKHVKTLPAELLTFDTESEHELRAEMNEFTRLGVWYSNTAKAFSPHLSFYLIPITMDLKPDFDAIRLLLRYPRGCNDWTQISESHYDKLIVCIRRFHGSTLLLRNIRHDLSPMSEPPPGSRESDYPTYRAYWVSTWSKKEPSKIWMPTDGPLLETVRLRRSNIGTYFLNPSPEDLLPVQAPLQGRLLPQAACNWLPLSYDLRRAFEALPALCHCITSAYRARCARSELGLPLTQEKLIIEALTIPSTSLPFNNQHLETVGDAVLQLCVTVHLFNRYPNRHEGQLTVLRQKHVNNKNLMYRALDIGLERYVNSENSSVYRWRYVLPETPSACYDGGPPIRFAMREYPRRSLQDCMEALIGASFLTGGITASLGMGSVLGLEFGGSLPWHERYTLDSQSNGIGALFSGLEISLGYKFRHNDLLLEALTHPSVVHSDTTSYQRLEFLGDAIIYLVVVKHLHDKYPAATSHQLSHLRSKVVCAPTLAHIATRKLGLHNRILMNSMTLSRALDHYAPLLGSMSGTEILRRCWKYDPPKALSDVFESLIGAVLVDSGYDYEQTAVVVEHVMEEVLDALSIDVPKDPISELTEWVAANGCIRKVVFRPEVKHTEFWDHKGIAVVVHGQVVVGPIVSTSLHISKFLAADRALTLLKDTGSGKPLAEICDCGMAMDTMRSELPTEFSPSTRSVAWSDVDEAEDIPEIMRQDTLEEEDFTVTY